MVEKRRYMVRDGSRILDPGREFGREVTDVIRG